MIVDRYYYHQLNKQEQAIYKAFYNGVMSHQEMIPIPVRGKFAQICSDMILGVFAHHKAQCEGIAKAVKVLLNTVEKRIIMCSKEIFFS